MRSKQLNFFIVEDDWKSINDFLSQNYVQIITQPIHDKDYIFSSDVSKTKEGEFKKVYMTCESFNKNVYTKFIDEQNYYLLDDICSYAIEFSRGGTYPNKPDEIARARFYFVTQYYQNEQIIRKDSDFIKWADNILAMFKKNFLLTNISGYGISDKALKWMKANGKILSDSGLTIK
ncbi:MAG: hypothetical protein H7257_11360 [Taibaiella sp.]|nr:hypothetical protein [Taibaiella sp.]